jgi:hypothetical protein
MRLGIVSDQANALLLSLSRPLNCDDGIWPTELYPHREPAEQANINHMIRLTSKGRGYLAEDKCGKDYYGIRISSLQAERMLEKRVPKSLILRVRD